MRCKFMSGLFLASVLILSYQQARTQQPGFTPAAPRSAQGQLTVTATVVSSVGLVTGPDGEQRIVVANGADPADNVSRLQPVRLVTLTPATEMKERAKVAKGKTDRASSGTH